MGKMAKKMLLSKVLILTKMMILQVLLRRRIVKLYQNQTKRNVHAMARAAAKVAVMKAKK